MAIHKLLCILLAFVSYYCQGQIEKAKSTYFVGQIDRLQIDSLRMDRIQADSMLKESLRQIDSLSHGNSKVKQMDSDFHDVSSLGETFVKNRARIYLATLKNEKLNDLPDFSSIKGISASCICFLDKDTVYIEPWFGFFAASGFGIKIYRNYFLSKYIEHLDQPNFKLKLTDEKFVGEILVDSKYQKLTLASKPEFKNDELITGLLEITSNNYYEKKYPSAVNTVGIKANVYFSCRLIKMTLMDQSTQRIFR